MFKIQLTNQVEVNSEEITVTFNDVKGVSLFNMNKHWFYFAIYIVFLFIR